MTLLGLPHIGLHFLTLSGLGRYTQWPSSSIASSSQSLLPFLLFRIWPHSSVSLWTLLRSEAAKPHTCSSCPRHLRSSRASTDFTSFLSYWLPAWPLYPVDCRCLQYFTDWVVQPGLMLIEEVKAITIGKAFSTENHGTPNCWAGQVREFSSKDHGETLCCSEIASMWLWSKESQIQMKVWSLGWEEPLQEEMTSFSL